jgi:hypothetical protein
LIRKIDYIGMLFYGLGNVIDMLFYGLGNVIGNPSDLIYNFLRGLFYGLRNVIDNPSEYFILTISYTRKENNIMWMIGRL